MMNGDALELPVSPISVGELEQVLASEDPDDLDPKAYLGTIKNLIWYLRRSHLTLAGTIAAILAGDDRNDRWQPTPDNINALPEPVRRYIHDLETNADPAGMVRENVLLRDQNAALQAMLADPLTDPKSPAPG